MKNGHWYTKDGQPMHWVPKKDGSGNRATTLADARKLGLLPSVTNILNVLAKPGLQDWITRQAVLAVVTAPDVQGEGLDDKISRVLEIERQQDQEAAAARDRGTQFHDALEQLAKGQTVDSGTLVWIEAAWKHALTIGTPVESEVILVGNGYAGRCDLIIRSAETDFVVDFKTAKKLPTKGSWNEHRLQLAAYAAAWQIGNNERLVKTANLYLSTIETGLFAWWENPPWKDDLPVFEAALAIWQWQNNYKP